jgi:L-2-hydroxyglutarate oxidase LhgO
MNSVMMTSLGVGKAAFDIGVVGGGIIGVATAVEFITRYPTLRVAVFEKEASLAQHQTGRNSGVIHSGVYYKLGSLKARLCVEGNTRMYDFCTRKGIPTKRVGKYIVATRADEVATLERLLQTGMGNGVEGSKRAKLVLWSRHSSCSMFFKA